RLAAAARVRLSYSAETLPLDRSVSAAYRAEPLGAALETLLRGSAVEPVVVGTDQVVLAPARQVAGAGDPPPRETAPPTTTATRITRLDDVVVTGSAAGAAERSLPFALDVLHVGVHGAEDGTATASLAQGVDGRVPGVWMWAQAPATLLARYGSIRGASSFGLSAPKVYLDGIEAANPLLLTALAPESIDRVEVIRGPQGAAFYGADAISGVVNVVLRHDGAADGRRQLELRSGVGAAGSAFTDRPAFTQDHGVALRAGSGARSAGFAIAGSTMGAYVPGASTQRLFGDVYGRNVGTRWALTGVAHVDAARASSAVSPVVESVLPSGYPDRLAAANTPTQSVWQYTVGGTATHPVGDRWTHVVTAGMNGYRLTGLSVDAVAVPTALDSALRAARGGADRGTLRASSAARLGGSGPLTGTLTVVGDYAVLREATATDGPAPSPLTGTAMTGTTAAPIWLQTVGVSAQAGAVWKDALFLTAGLRGERNDGYAAASRYAGLPLLGVTAVHDWGNVTAKLRSAYGRGLRPARTASRATTWRGTGAGTRLPDLEPEEQQGFEGGLDLFAGRFAAFHVTGFDQLASGLIQQVSYVPGNTPGSGGMGNPGGGMGGPGQNVRRLAYELQNVGEITNRGLELEGVWRNGPLSLAGTFARVDSRVRRLAAGYTGDLRPGDRMLEVPARTIGLDASWSRPRWSAGIGTSRAFDWTNYDRVALAQAYTSNARQSRELVGAQLRTFWRTYPGVTHLHANASRDFATGFAAVLSGDNLLDNQRGEPDNATVLPGRTITLGVRARF
ncbi:MAG: TonB-dependent receptor plug domain-containing protein, partial [Gemmatirosa sp.]|nr:TonB-dependent receptor plug domain-containing protein [Gemmatirosa sp.]